MIFNKHFVYRFSMVLISWYRSLTNWFVKNTNILPITKIYHPVLYNVMIIFNTCQKSSLTKNFHRYIIFLIRKQNSCSKKLLQKPNTSSNIFTQEFRFLLTHHRRACNMTKDEYIVKIMGKLKKIHSERVFKIILLFLENETTEN